MQEKHVSSLHHKGSEQDTKEHVIYRCPFIFYCTVFFIPLYDSAIATISIKAT